MTDGQVRRFFDTHLAASAEGIQRDARRITFDRLVAVGVSVGVPLLAVAIGAAIHAGAFGLHGLARWGAIVVCGLVGVTALVMGFRRLIPPAFAAGVRVAERFTTELAGPAVRYVRPGWTYDTECSLSLDELFASKLFQRIALTRFTASARIRGRAHDLPFEMHEILATGEGPNRFMRIVLTGLLAHIRLPALLPGHVRICRHSPDKTWRRPAMDGYRAVDASLPILNGHYHVDATPDAVDPAAIPGLVLLMADLATRGWLVHGAFGGLSAWVAIERSRTWFEPRVLPPYTAGDLLELEHAFAIVDQVADQLGSAVPVA